MKIQAINHQVSVSDQLTIADLEQLKALGVAVIVCNRPDAEAQDQTDFADIAKAAAALAIKAVNLPFTGNQMTQEQVDTLATLLQEGQRLHAYCRTGNRSTQIIAASERQQQALLAAKSGNDGAEKLLFDIAIVGAGSGGIATCASLLKRRPDLNIALIDPAEYHYYQPGWTMVGGGIFSAAETRRKTADLIPQGVTLIVGQVATFYPDQQRITLGDGRSLHYGQLVVAAGLKLDWSAVEGLEETLGKNSVTSNYRYDLAPYTWELVSNLKQGKALFTQPPMPIKCAGAPQKAMYLSADSWQKKGLLKAINIHFYNAGAVLFGVAAYVPALQSYIDKYAADVHFQHNLIKVDGPGRQAWFSCKDADGNDAVVQTSFDMLHVVPPQCAPDFIRQSPLADANGWLDVDPQTLQHKVHKNIWGLGDVTNTTNAKTMAAARKQAPVVAKNIASVLAGAAPASAYDGYGSCPLTVERGKIVLAEFGYAGKLLPSFPQWLINGTRPSRLAWILKTYLLPSVYWQLMLKGREWMV
ncbi:MAG: bifunctional protein tyrosine phosphatase family protein/NAD(P)/FAD-dependent oxidoreductase [Pseudomonadales bacterium]|nr:bifunctional protein tyrosine phosphatase family protein/NAD(P)/FAD-dependent oxidoreductase [Pseudomonadales bacterium]